MSFLPGSTAARRLRARALIMALALLAPGAARADIRDFPFTYDWRQALRGEKEIAYHTRYQRQGSSWVHELEFERGLTDRLAIAPYVVFKQGDGRSLHFDAVKLETRYQLGRYSPGRVLPGLYLEIEKPNGEAVEVEGKVILSRYTRGGDDLSLNYILEGSTRSGSVFEHAYSLAYARALGRRGMRGGLEWIHELSSRRINAGPVLGLPVGDAWVVAGYAFPVNGTGDNRAEFRLIAEYQWF